MDRKTLMAETVPFSVEYEGETLTGQCQAKAITGQMLSVASSASEGKNVHHMAGVLSQVVSTWDMTDDAKPYPPTEKNLLALPVDLLAQIFKAVVEAAAPSKSGK